MAKPPLNGIRVIELALGIAGPHVGHILAMFGAEVIKIESRLRPDYFRGYDPEKWEKRVHFAQVSLNKKELSLNLKSPKGLEIFKRLVKVSDVVVENFSPGVMDRWGIGYSQLKQIRPDIILLSMQGLGAYGPKKNYKAWGGNLLGMMGEDYLWNHPDVSRVISAGPAHPDWINGIMACVALTAAICYHTRTGRGQFIEAAQIEMGASRLGPEYLESTLNKRNSKPIGNRSPFAAPHGCYPCKGDDRWCAIAVYSDEEWWRLCRVMGEPEWAKDPKLCTVLGRLENVAELDRRLGEWTAQYEPLTLMKMLQDAGIVAGAVQNGEGLNNDVHLKERGFLVELDHLALGNVVYAGLPMKFSESPGSIHSPAPLMGEHNDYVCGQLLGMSQAEIDALAEEGVLA